jgi:hypothetical protein
MVVLRQAVNRAAAANAIRTPLLRNVDAQHQCWRNRKVSIPETLCSNHFEHDRPSGKCKPDTDHKSASVPEQISPPSASPGGSQAPSSRHPITNSRGQRPFAAAVLARRHLRAPLRACPMPKLRLPPCCLRRCFCRVPAQADYPATRSCAGRTSRHRTARTSHVGRC